MKIKKLQQGFSLPELLVAIAIVGLISTITVVNFRAGQKKDVLNFAADELASNLRGVQVSALSGELVNGEEPRGGYGMNFVSGQNSYTYFANADNVDYVFGEDDAEIRTYNLPQGVTLDSSNLDVVFKQPRPTIFINGAEEEIEAQIILRHEDVTETKTIIINRISGRIDVN